MEQRVELLAPAGSPEGFYGAIHAGADAVYLGGNRFGARAYAENFTEEELLECIRYAHIWGRKVYLTVNTLVKENELSALFQYLKPLYEAGLDGVIVQDLGVFRLIRDCFPDMEIHVSTQMNITGIHGAKLLKSMGAVRIVPARELSLEEIKRLKHATGLQVETFIHGAMCYCYSGQCLFSSILGGRSGNRGRCAQPCRLPFQVEYNKKINEECYPLSLKDMCTIEHIPEFIAAGIDSFKIEGRMKKPEYTAGVTAIYRKYIDRYYAGEDCTVIKEDYETLGSLYIRSQRQDGYYYRRNGRDMVTLKNPSYGNDNPELLDKIREDYICRKPYIDIKFQAVFKVNEPARLSVVHDGELKLNIEGECVSAAIKQPITEENIVKQLGKLGDTVFHTEEISVSLDSKAFYSLKSLNDIRRHAVKALEDILICENGFKLRRQAQSQYELYDKSFNINKTENKYVNSSYIHISLQTEEQIRAVSDFIKDGNEGMKYQINRVYLDADLIDSAFSDKTYLIKIFNELKMRQCELCIALPPIIRGEDESFMSRICNLYVQNRELFNGFLARSVDCLGFIDSMVLKADDTECPTQVYTDAGVYIWNRQSLNFINEIITDADISFLGFCIPYELKSSDQRNVLKGCGIPCEKVIYGRIPLMLTANCIVKTIYGCKDGKEDSVCFLIDRYRKRFPVVRNCRHCFNTIYNCLPLSLHGELSKWSGAADLRVDFTIEDEGETKRILQYFMTGAEGDMPYREYTTGHEKRGAE